MTASSKSSFGAECNAVENHEVISEAKSVSKDFSPPVRAGLSAQAGISLPMKIDMLQSK